MKDLKLEDETKSIEGIHPKDHESDEIKNELHKIKRYEIKVIMDNLFYESSKHIYDFKIFKTIRSFVDSIYNHKIEINEANQEQAYLLEYILSFNSKNRSRTKINWCIDSAKNRYESRILVLSVFKSGLFLFKPTKGTGLKMLTPR